MLHSNAPLGGTYLVLMQFHFNRICINYLRHVRALQSSLTLLLCVHLNFILRQNYVQVPNFEETILIFFFLLLFGFLLSMKINWSLGIPFCFFSFFTSLLCVVFSSAFDLPVIFFFVFVGCTSA